MTPTHVGPDPCPACGGEGAIVHAQVRREHYWWRPEVDEVRVGCGECFETGFVPCADCEEEPGTWVDQWEDRFCGRCVVAHGREAASSPSLAEVVDAGSPS